MTPEEKAKYIRQYFFNSTEKEDGCAYQVSRWISSELTDLFNEAGAHHASDKVLADKLKQKMIYWRDVKQEMLQKIH